MLPFFVDITAIAIIFNGVNDVTYNFLYFEWAMDALSRSNDVSANFLCIRHVLYKRRSKLLDISDKS